MKIYRGPNETDFLDDRHALVDTISSEVLKDSIEFNKRFEFNISKDAIFRKAVCNAFFEDDDIVPIVSGAISKLKIQQEKLKNIKEIVENKILSDEEKIVKIKQIF